MLRHLLNLIVTRGTHRPIRRSCNWISLGLLVSFVSSNWGITIAAADAFTDTITDKKAIARQVSAAKANAFTDAITNKKAIARQVKVKPHLFLENGIYLYGQSPQPHQLGQAYMVFEVIQGRLIGGFYMPRSSFDCFSGSVEGNQLALNVVDSYSQEVHDYSIAYSNVSTVATSTPSGASPSITLDGFHPIETLSQTDHDILKTCQADFDQN